MLLKIYKTTFFMLLFTTLVFMSGSVYGINYKIPLVLICGLSLFGLLYKTKETLNKRNIILLIFLLVSFVYAMFIGSIKGYELSFVFQEFIGLISPLFILALYNQKLIKNKELKKALLFGALIYSVIKVVIVILIAINITTFPDVSSAITSIFDYSVVSMLIFENPFIVRIYTVNDLLIAFIPLVLFSNEKIIKSKHNILFSYIIFSISMFLCYSRYLIVIFIVVSILPHLNFYKMKIRNFLIWLFSFALLLIYLINNGIPVTIRERFSFTGKNTAASDAIRDTQFVAIKNMIEQNFILGAGTGSYSSDYIRLGYIYELQWMSLLFKFGIPMFILIMIIIALYFLYNYKLSPKSVTSFLLLLSTSLFNPYLETTVMGVSLLIIMSQYGNNTE